jgi:hypothetical protein
MTSISSPVTDLDKISAVIDEILASIKEKGTYARASLTYREQIKNWDIKFEDLFRILAHLIEEDDATLYDLLRIFYMVAPRWFDRKKVILLHPNKRNLLETAIMSDNWNFANFLVLYAVEGDYVLGQNIFWMPPGRKARPDQWGKALQKLIKSYIQCRALPSGVQNNNLKSMIVARMKNFKSIIDNGYATLFDLTKYPSALILMIRLGVDYNSMTGISLPYAIWNSRAKKDIRARLLNFVASVDQTLFDAPCGPFYVNLIYECWRASDLFIIRNVPALRRQKIDMNMKDSRGRGIGCYINPKQIILKGEFSPTERFDYVMTAVKNENIPVINYILKNEAYQADDYPEITRALEALITKDKRVLSHFLEKTLVDFTVVAYCIVRGHKASSKQMWKDLVEAWELTPKEKDEATVKDRILLFESNVDSICYFYELSDDAISLIMLEMSFEDIMSLFSTSTTMQRVFGRLKDQNLWKRVAAKMFNGFKFKFLQSQPIPDWQSHVMTEMKWRRNWLHQRFIERTIFPKLAGNVSIAIDDNWLVTSDGLTIRIWSCHTMQLLDEIVFSVGDVLIGDPFIVDSKPTSLKVVIGGVGTEPLLFVVDPMTKDVRTIKSSVPLYGSLLCFQFQSRLLLATINRIFELDVLTGVIKLVKEFDNFAPRAVAVNLNEDAILLLNNRAWEPSLMLDSQMNAKQIEPYSHHTLQPHVVELSFRQSDSIFTGSSTLEFGQWSMHLGTETVFGTLIDITNSRVLIKRRDKGIGMLLHSDLRKWYTAWTDTPQKFVAMNSRYLFLFDETSRCLYCRDFNWTK